MIRCPSSLDVDTAGATGLGTPVNVVVVVVVVVVIAAREPSVEAVWAAGVGGEAVGCRVSVANTPPIIASVARRARAAIELPGDPQGQAILDDLKLLVRREVRIQERTADHLGTLHLTRDLSLLRRPGRRLERDGRTDLGLADLNAREMHRGRRPDRHRRQMMRQDAFQMLGAWVVDDAATGGLTGGRDRQAGGGRAGDRLARDTTGGQGERCHYAPRRELRRRHAPRG